jgi:hypothetical protein
MGTQLYFDVMLPATDAEARGNTAVHRQLELLTLSGTNEIHLRLGRLDSQDDGDGYMVRLDNAAAQKLLDALEGATERLAKFMK